MKKIDTTNISGLAKAPFIKDTHDHIKESIQESTSNIIKGLLGTYTTGDLIVLYGCVVTANIPGTSSITAGAIYYNGEIYDVDANASLITSGSDTLVWGVATSYLAADSTLAWSDGTIRDLHRIDKLALSAGLSGSGIADYNASTVKLSETRKKVQIGDWNMDSSDTVTIPHGLGANWRKILNIKGWVRNDADTANYNLVYRSASGTIDLAWNYDATNVYIYRLTGELFDSASFDSTSYNRGYIYIEYGDI